MPLKKILKHDLDFILLSLENKSVHFLGNIDEILALINNYEYII